MNSRGFSSEALLALMLCTWPGRITAQVPASPKAGGLDLGIALSYFPLYVTEDTHTRQLGFTVLASAGSADSPRFEVSYTHVPQETTSSSAAPRLHVLRGAIALAHRLGPDAPIWVRGTVGGEAVNIDAQTIDCGDFPLCSEWAPRDATRAALVLAAGFRVKPQRYIDVRADVRLHRPFGEPWSPAGDSDSLVELSIGAILIRR